jgi:hypothetical protein
VDLCGGPFATVLVMSEFVFSPPLELVPRVTVHTLSDAAAYVQSCPQVRRPFMRAGVLRSMLAATTSDQQCFAGKGFRLWADAEGLLRLENANPPG